MNAEKWLQRCGATDVPAPATALDWEGYATALYWANLLEVDAAVSLAKSQTPTDWRTHSVQLGIDVYHCLVLAGHGDNAAELRTAIQERYQREWLAFRVQFNEGVAHADYLIDATKPDSSLLPRRHLEALRGLYPTADAFSLQGWGYVCRHPIDHHRKTGVPKSQLPPRWSVEMNIWLEGLLFLWFRPTDWSEYAVRVGASRQAFLVAIGSLIRGLNEHWGTTDLLGTFRVPSTTAA
jgi:hypothetical protein